MIIIDAGNTNTVIAIYINNEVKYIKRIESKDLKKFEYEINNYFKIKKKYLKNKFFFCILSSVVPKLNIIVKKTCLKNNFIFFNLTAKNIPFNIKFKYDKKLIGADRLANTVALVENKMSNCLVVDFGTATTFDLIKNNTYHGGLIFPGIIVSHNSLIKNAALLKKTKIIKLNKLVYNNTKNSIQSGFYWGYLSAINGIIIKLSKEYKFKPKIILTGGLAHIFKSKIIYDPKIKENLTLEGLGIIGKKINEK